jgi:carboxymethylenebutenolidase
LQAAESDEHLVIMTAAAHADDRPVASPAATTPPIQEIIGQSIAYGEVDGMQLNGYLAKPLSTSDDLPGLIVIHEWWGLNDNIQRMAERLAAQGYVALAVDLYNGASGTTPKEAMGLMQKLQNNVAGADANLLAAYRYLNEKSDAPRIGVIGWCLGGQWSPHTALLLPDTIDAMVMYYGSVVTDEAQLSTLQMPILGNFAEKDPIIPVDSVNTFNSVLTELGKEIDVKIYPGASHGFSNPSGLAYNAEAAEDAWNRSVAFLDRHLQ